MTNFVDFGILNKQFQNQKKKKKTNTKITTVKPVLSSLSKIDETKVLKTNGSLMKVKSIAECSLGAF